MMRRKESGAKCKRIQGPRNGSFKDPISVNDVQHLQHSNEMRFKCYKVDVEGMALFV